MTYRMHHLEPRAVSDGFKTMNSARAIVDGIERIQMMRKQQAKHAHYPQSSLARQFDLLASGVHQAAYAPFSIPLSDS
jgi:hypothetical protein